MDVTGKYGIVTGASSGIGKAIAIELAKNGARLILADINYDQLENIVSEVESFEQKTVLCRVDVSDQKSVDGMVEVAIDNFENIDFLVNCAGVIGASDWGSRPILNDQDWDLIHQVNVRGLMRVTDAVVPSMIKRNYGKIVNIASIAGRTGSVTNVAYATSKAAVINLTQGSASKYSENNINVNAVCPGLLWTPMWEKIAESQRAISDNKDQVTGREVVDEHVKNRIPLGREQTPEDIAYLVSFLVSDYSSNITGQAINVSGGSHFN